MTYRKGFAPLLIEKNKVANLTSDAGWGCVIRCSQMLLANTLRVILRNEIVSENKALSKYHSLSSSSFDCKKSNYLTTDQINILILSLFDDDKRNQTEHPFSIQNIVEVGLQVHGKLPGEWYGVCNLNEIVKSLHETYNFDANLSDNFLGNFKICSFKNGEIVTKDVLMQGLGPSKYQELVEGKVLDGSDDHIAEKEDSILSKL